ncbi:MAG: B12-binding domain-containing radical SAM protein [Candidatus Atribacteria bacterium]|nr:B12-binding domain-containing radical SAM protein [Candidatus Atribacteria bacterium]
MKILFINPPHPDLINPHAQAPLGILYLAGSYRGEGVDVDIMNLAGSRKYAVPDADIYAITGTFLDVAAVNALARRIRETDRGARVVVGGPISLSRAQLDMTNIDLVVHGEAEEAFDIIESGEGYAECAAPADLDALAFPARDLWHGPLGGNVFINGRNYFGGGSATILTTRGCPMNCAFCAGPALVSRTIRRHSPERVVAEMEQCVTDFGIRQFRFSDEFFTAVADHWRGVTDAIMRSRLLGYGDGVAWRASIGVNPHSLEMYRAMRAAGCREVSLGIESADPDVLALICPAKGDMADRYESLANARQAGLLTRSLLMVGTPGSTAATLTRNLTFIRTAPTDALAVTIFSPIPGCDIAADPEKYHCRIVPHAAQSICVRTPDGADLNPRIYCDGLTVTALQEQIAATISAAETTGRLGGG